MDARSASQRFRRRSCRKHVVSNAAMQILRAPESTLEQGTSVGPDSEFKIAILLPRGATYPSGARRRAVSSGGRAIAIAVRDGRRGRRGAIYAGDRDISLGSRALDGGRLSCEGFRHLGILLSAFSIFQPELARPRAYDRERSTSSSRVKPFPSHAQKFAHARAPESETKHGSPSAHPTG